MARPQIQLLYLFFLLLPISCTQIAQPDKKAEEKKVQSTTKSTVDPTATTKATPPARSISLNTHIVSVTSSAEYEKHKSPDAFDGDCGTAWSAKIAPKASPWVEITFDKPRHISQIRLTTGWERINTHGQDLFMLNMQVRSITAIFDNTTERTGAAPLESRLMVLDSVDITAQKVRFRVDELWPGAKYKDLAISDIVLLGTPQSDDDEPLQGNGDTQRCDLQIENRIQEKNNGVSYMSKEAVCERLETRAHLVLDDFEQKIDASMKTPSPLQKNAKNIIVHHGKCHSAQKGSWMLLPFNISYQVDYIPDLDEDFKIFGNHLVVYIDDNGTTYVGPQTFALDEDPFDHTFDAISELSLLDFDNDGVFELVMDRSNDEDGAIFSIWTFKAGKVTKYKGLAHIQIQQLVDYDKDGIKDIISFFPWRTDANHWGSTEYDQSIGVPSVLYHGKGDGTFSPRDKVAKGYLREQCKNVSAPPFLSAPDYDWENDVLLRISCARLRGKTAQEVTTQLTREWTLFKAPADKSIGMTLDDFSKWAALKPPCTI
ncbi:MAG: discoidin domain-containing protein [Deltaproteobacteria bacterium]|nr:discoidin domain-containing protein [Deltaproteobacteria bacterium]